MKSVLYDIAVVVGCTSITYATWLIWPPLPWLFAGGAFTAWGIIGAGHFKKGGDK